jgi:conjugal transfer ATP-binding protein TraC
MKLPIPLGKPPVQQAPAGQPAGNTVPQNPAQAAAPAGPKAPPPPPKNSGLHKLEKGMTSIIDIIAPSSVEVDFRYIRVGERYCTTLFIIGYPRYVSPSWLEPIIDYDHTMDISMFCYPTSSSDVLTDLRRKIAEMEATIASDQKNGHPVDPKIEASLQDALALQEELAKGVERFFQFSFYITLSSETASELQEAIKRFQTELASMLLVGKIATLQSEEGFKSTMPIGQDRLFITRNMDTTSLASTFPFTSAVMTQNKGVLYGMNQQNGSLIIFDRFSLENANEIVFGKSGAGKSYYIKLEIMRQFMMGTEVIVVDPEGEYGTLTKTLGGEVVDFSASSPIKINPFDLSQIVEEGTNELGLKILSLHGLLRLIMGNLDPAHDAALDAALIETYRQKGITPDPATQRNKPPLIEDLYKTLMGMENQIAKEMAFRLEKFIKGSAAGIFNQPTNFDFHNSLTIFNIRNLEEELRPIAMHIILDFVWTKVKKSLHRRLLILDEAWYMMKFEDSASFVYSIAKRARKYYLGLTTATQDVEDFLKTDYGKAVLTNSSMQILLKQGTAEVDMVGETFYLSEGERELLLAADVGEGLFFAGKNHVAMKVIAAPFEHQLITSNPEEIMRRQKEQQLKAQQEAQESVQRQPAFQTNAPSAAAAAILGGAPMPTTPQQHIAPQVSPLQSPTNVVQPASTRPSPTAPTPTVSLGPNPTNPLMPTPGIPGVATYANAKLNPPPPPAVKPPAGGTTPRNPYISQVP